MERALEIFYEEYKVFLDATEKETKEAIEVGTPLMKRLKEKITEEDMKKLFSLGHGLFQTNYLLMEYHLRLHNYMWAYSGEMKEQIDRYDEVYKKAGEVSSKLIKLHNYLKSKKNTNNELNA